VEQELATGLREREVAELVDDQQLDAGELPLEAEKTLLVLGLDHLMDDCDGGGEAGLDAALAGREPTARGFGQNV